MEKNTWILGGELHTDSVTISGMFEMGIFYIHQGEFQWPKSAFNNGFFFSLVKSK